MSDRMTDSEREQIFEYYAAGGESTRLTVGIGQLEAARTKEIIKRHLPPTPAVIYDIGGGTGYYAFWLAGMGHQVHLLELSPENIQISARFETDSGLLLADCQECDARDLPKEDQSADLVLLLGPLYHLTEKSDRLSALNEAYRVLKPGGMIFIATINRFANILYGLTTYDRKNQFLEEQPFRDMFVREIESGQHYKPEDYPYFLARAYFHRVDELEKEVISSGFILENIYAVEGPGWLIPEFDEVWQQAEKRNLVLETIRQVETEQSLIGLSPHYLAVAKKI